MRKRILAAFLAVTAVAAGLGSAAAITDGAPDGTGHPYVGLVVFYDSANVPLWRCSSTLLSDTILLTAGHCTEAPAAKAQVWFDTGPILRDADFPTTPGTSCGLVLPASAPWEGYPCGGGAAVGDPYTHPQYNPNAFYLYDLGVVVLDTPVTMSAYGALPGLNQLDGLARKRRNQDVTFTAVGYGLQKAFPDAAAWKDSAQRIRMVAHPQLIQINGGIVGYSSLLLSNNTNTGGTCFGDSGGPNFIGTSNVIAGVTSFGLNGNCAGTGGVYRIDRSDDLTWIATFLGP